MRIGIIAAVPLELKYLVHGWERIRNRGRHIGGWTHVDDAGDRMIAVCAGMGADAARRAFAAAEADGPLDGVLSVGFAGATDPALRVGQCAVASEVIDARTGERFASVGGEGTRRIVSTAVVADASEKRRLLGTYGAMMVDMEAATVARMAQQRAIPMCCIKAISDGADAVLPDVTPYLREGQLRMLPFLASMAVRPRSWPPLVRLGSNSSVAAKSLAGSVDRFLLHKTWAHARRAGSIEE